MVFVPTRTPRTPLDKYFGTALGLFLILVCGAMLERAIREWLAFDAYTGNVSQLIRVQCGRADIYSLFKSSPDATCFEAKIAFISDGKPYIGNMSVPLDYGPMKVGDPISFFAERPSFSILTLERPTWEIWMMIPPLLLGLVFFVLGSRQVLSGRSPDR
jgi:hypothetical protein